MRIVFLTLFDTSHVLSCNVIRARLLDFFCRQIIFIGAVDWKIPQILPNTPTVGLKPLVNRWQKKFSANFLLPILLPHTRATYLLVHIYERVRPPLPLRRRYCTMQLPAYQATAAPSSSLVSSSSHRRFGSCWNPAVIHAQNCTQQCSSVSANSTRK